MATEFLGIPNEPSARTYRETRQGWKYVREYTDRYRVRALSASVTRAEVIATSGVPTRDTILAEDTAARVKSREAEIIDPGPLPIWMVTVTYSTEDEDRQQGDTPLYPDTPARISYNFDRKEIAVQRDNQSLLIKNTAGDPFDPPVMVDLPIPTKTIQVNMSTSDFSPDMMAQYFNAVNSASYDGFGKGQALVKDISANPESYTDADGNSIAYWAVQIVIQFNPNGWQPRLLSQGYREKNDDGDLSQIYDPNGQPITSPAVLDEDGHALFGDDVSDAAYVDAEIYEEVSFSGLNFVAITD